MREQITVEFMLGLLLVTSYASIGLVALWAATSPRHWFARSLVLIAVLALPLVLPAYEPLVMFSIEAGLIVVGVNLWRRRKSQTTSLSHTQATNAAATSPPATSIRFSLATLLLAMVLVAVCMTMLARAMKYFHHLPAAYASMIVDGTAAGAIFLIALWLLVARRKWIAVPTALLLLAGLTALLLKFDCQYLAITWGWGWPPDQLGYFGGVYQGRQGRMLFARSITFWVSVQLALVVVEHLIAALARLTHKRRVDDHSSTLARVAIAGVLVVLAAFPLYTLWQTAHPLPVPKVAAVSPNGLDDIVAAGNDFANSQMLNFVTRAEPRSTGQLDGEISNYSVAFTRLRIGLDKEIQLNLFPEGAVKPDDYARSNTQLKAAWNSAWALGRRADLARRQQQFGGAVARSLEILRMAAPLARGGLLEQAMSEIGIEPVAAYRLYEVAPHLSPDECREVIAALVKFDDERETVEIAEHRERIRSENQYGWVGKLTTVLADFTSEDQRKYDMNVRRHRIAQAALRLLAVELAVRAYERENGALPERLDELVPKYFDRVPSDPFGSPAERLRYKLTADGFLVYSVGVDGDDDAGRSPARDAAQYAHPDGDWRFGDFYAPPSATTQTASGRVQAAVGE